MDLCFAIGFSDGSRMLIGYARVSTEEQSLDLQHDALRSVGCERIFDDKAGGARTERPGLNRALEQLRDGDTLIIWRLDRLGRSLKDLIARAEALKEMGVGLKSLHESIDTTSSGGQLIFHVFGALAEFERNLICELTQAGLNAARTGPSDVTGITVRCRRNRRQIRRNLYLISHAMMVCRLFSSLWRWPRLSLLRTFNDHSPMTWAHINMPGEYDVSDEKRRDAIGILPLKSVV